MSRLIPLAAIALLASASALADFPADVVAKARNNASGEIVFTTRATEACKDLGLEAYATSGAGDVATGCWRVVDDYFLVVYSDGHRRAYKIDGLTFSDWFIAKVNQPKGTPL